MKGPFGVCHRFIFHAALFAIATTAVAAPQREAGPYTLPPSPRVDIDLDSSWAFNRADVAGAGDPTFDDKAWASVSLPHTWNNTDGQDGGNDYYRGIGWYRKHYTVPATYEGRSVFLQFDGANRSADVYVNGTLVGHHAGGHARFRFDVTPQLAFGHDNLIAVKVDNGVNPDIPPVSADFTFFGGLYRNAHLLITDKVRVTPLDFASSGVYLKTTNVSAASATLQVTAKLANAEGAARSVTTNAVVVDAAEKVVARLTDTRSIGAGEASDVMLTTKIATPHLWNGLADPYQYKVHVEVKVDGKLRDLVTEPFGFRFFSVDAERGFSLNGHSLKLHGVNRHQDRLDKGWAIGPAEHDEDFALIKEMGANTIRLAHYQHASYFYDLCDRNGMIVWAEIPVVNNITESPAFYANAKQMLTELIRQNYNRPSIVFWSIANEIMLRKGDDPNQLLDQLTALARAEDDTRLTALANAGDSTTDPVVHHTDVVGFNVYFGWYRGEIADFETRIDAAHAAGPALKIGITEYGAGSSIRQHSDTPTAKQHSEEYQSLFHEAYWNVMKARPYIWGTYVWNMFDFAVDARKEGDTPGRNDKGLVTYDRKTRKDSFYWYKANWTTAPMVYITSRRFEPRVTAATDIKVYSNTSRVQLIVNGTSLGSKAGKDHMFTWPGVPLKLGANQVEAIGTEGSAVVKDNVTWTREESPAPAATTPTAVGAP